MSDERKPTNRDPAEQPTVEYHSADSGGSRADFAQPRITETLPETIGPFRVLGKLGAGGMGVVYEAEQRHPRRPVALKVVRAGSFADEQQLRMFRREADALARLKHPGIAGIHQVGETDEGQPYLVMELIRGLPLDEYLALQPPLRTRDGLEQRLRLFQQICDAVHYAHQRGIIHRDLKPSNVLIVEPEEEAASGSTASTSLPRAKILDFGLARMADAEATQMTEVGMIKGTLQYMSPEQTSGRPDEVDIRADVYALGALLYEMLAGARPYDLKKEALTEAVRIIREKTPEPLSSVWKAPFRPDPDIETIVGKALEKEPDRRYASVAAFSEDVERYLGSQPILARPPSATYQLRKMFARHRALFATAAVALGFVVVAAVVSTVLWFRAEREAERAQVEAAKSEEVAAFMTEMLEGVGPAVARGRDTTMLREILDGTVDRIDAELRHSPEVARKLQSHVGKTYFDLGELEAAETQLRAAWTLARAVHGDAHPETLAEKNNVATVLAARDQMEQAETLFRETLAGRRLALQPGDPDIGVTLIDLANLLNRKSLHDEAEPMYLEGLEILRTAHPDGDSRLAVALNSLGNLYHAQARYDDAEKLYREAEAMHVRLLGEDHPDVLVDRHNIAYLLKNRGDLEASERMFLEVLETARRVYGGEHEDVAQVLLGLGSVHAALGDFRGAEDYYRQSLEMTGRVLGEGSQAYGYALNALAGAIKLSGDPEGAEGVYREALAIQRRILGDGSSAVATTRSSLASVLVTLERLDEASAELEEAIRVLRGLYGNEHNEVLTALDELGRLKRGAGDLDASERILRDVLEIRLRTLGPENAYVGKTQYELGRLLIDRDTPAAVAEGQQWMRDSIETYIAAKGEDYPAVPLVRFRLGRDLMSREAYAEAETLLLAAHAGLVRAYGADNRNTLSAEEGLAELYQAWGRPADANRWQR